MVDWSRNGLNEVGSFEGPHVRLPDAAWYPLVYFTRDLLVCIEVAGA